MKTKDNYPLRLAIALVSAHLHTHPKDIAAIERQLSIQSFKPVDCDIRETIRRLQLPCFLKSEDIRDGEHEYTRWSLIPNAKNLRQAKQMARADYADRRCWMCLEPWQWEERSPGYRIYTVDVRRIDTLAALLQHLS